MSCAAPGAPLEPGRGWRRLLWVNRRASATRIVFDLHRSAGAAIASSLLLSTATGFTLVYLKDVRNLIALVSRVEPFPVIPWRAHRRVSR